MSENSMTPQELLRILNTAAGLKLGTRHCDTAPGRKESIADHSWRMALTAMLLTGVPEYADLDMNKVIRMCLIHDLGETFTGDIPTFVKTSSDKETEEKLLSAWVDSFPEPQRREWEALYEEMNAQESREAKLYRALDKLEAVISHNESDISTWLPLEYNLQKTYGAQQVLFSPWLQDLKKEIDTWTDRKIREEGEQN